MNNTKTGEFISARRKELGLTQNQLAERLNMTDKAVSKWENGKGAPDIATLIPLAEVLEVSVVEILNGKQMEQVELQTEADAAIVDTMKKSKKKNILCVICAVIVVSFLFSIIPAYNYFSTISINDMDALIEMAYAASGPAFENYKENRVVKTVKRGDYLVFLIENPTYMTDVVFRKNEMFQNRYQIVYGSSEIEKGEVRLSAFGENGMAINVLYGVDIPSQYTKYTFGYRNSQYFCPIEDGVVLEVFIDASGSFAHPYDIEMIE